MSPKKQSKDEQQVAPSEPFDAFDDPGALPDPRMAIQLADPHNKVSPISENQLRKLWEKTPPHAIRKREGGGGKMYSYVPHGYVEFKLNEAFGGDWDFELLPYFEGGNAFYLHTGEVRDKRNPAKILAVNQSVTVVGRLTIRVRNPENPADILSVIVKTEPGSAWFYPENEFGDSVKGAASDSFKRCAFRLGVAADMYYDDEKAQEYFQATERRQRETEEKIARELAAKAPADTVQVITKVKNDYNIGGEELFKRLYNMSFAEGAMRMKQEFTEHTPDELWTRVKAYLFRDEPNGTGNED